MRDIGELNVVTTPWDLTRVPAEPATSESTSRTIHYTHPVNVPMAPPTAKARKQQQFYKFGNAGLWLETCTVVEDVPMTDCFVVEDRLWLHGAKDESRGCVLSVTFQIRFVKGKFYSISSNISWQLIFIHHMLFFKGTMFRKIIENATRKEYAFFWNQFACMVRGLGKESEEIASEPRSSTVVLEVEEEEMSLSYAMSSVRRLSRRLSSIVAKPPSNSEGVHLEGVKETHGISIQSMVAFVLDSGRCIRKEVSDNDFAFVVVCVVFFLMISLNIVAVSQMMMLSRFLQKLDARLENIDLNQAILMTLSKGKGSDA
jgi:hypothetical protein